MSCGRSPETFEAGGWAGATGPARRSIPAGMSSTNGIGPFRWNAVTACEPGRRFRFAVLLGDRPVNNWHYRLTPTDGAKVT